MSLESWGDSLPAGKPVAVASAAGRVDCFGIAAGGRVLQWTALDGAFTGPTLLPSGLNVPASVPCAIVLPDGSFHLFAIAPGGPLLWWRSSDGKNWNVLPFPANMPAGLNGLAVASPAPDRLDVFGIGGGDAFHGGPLLHWALNAGGQLLYGETLPGSQNQLSTSLLSAVSPAPGRVEVFAVGNNGFPWHWSGGSTPNSFSGPLFVPSVPVRPGGGFAAVAANGQVELFGISNGALCQWSGSPMAFTGYLPMSGPSGVNLPEGAPAAAFVAPGRLEVFAIGPGNPGRFVNGLLRPLGGALWRWRREDGGAWTGPMCLDGSLSVGGVGLAVGATRIDAFGIHAGLGGDNSLQHWPAGVAGSAQDQADAVSTPGWVNWAGNQAVPAPLAHCRPASREELVAIVKDADRMGKRVRAVGSSWSFTDIAVTSDFIVETHGVGAILSGVVPGALSVSGRRFVHVEAGIILQNLMTYLDTQDLAPTTMGGASGQTLAGVLSTSVHGCDFDRGPITEMVRAIHLIDAAGKEHWIEPAQGITDKNKLQPKLGPQVTIHYDDDWFNAVLVSVGTLGIIYSVVLEPVAQHDIIETIQSSTWSKVREQLANGAAFSGDGFFDGTIHACANIASQNGGAPAALRGLQVAIDPAGPIGDHKAFVFSRATGQKTTPAAPDPTMTPIINLFWDETALLEGAILAAAPAAVLTAMGAVAGLLPIVGLSPAAPLLPMLGGAVAVTTVASIGVTVIPLVAALVGVLRLQGAGAVFDFMGKILNGHADLIAGLTTELTKALIKPGTGRNWAHTKMAPSDDITKLARGLAIEIAFDASDARYLDAIDEMLAALDQARGQGLVLGGWFSLRFVGRSRAFLSPQQSSRTCMVELTGVRALDSTPILLDWLEGIARKHGAIRHWGMFRMMNDTEVAAAYPGLERWRKVRWALTQKGTKRTFDNPFAERSGLTKAPQLGAGTSSGGGGTVLTTAVAAVAPHAAAGTSADGRLEVFTVGAGGNLGHIWQSGGGWSSWFDHGGTLVGSPAMARGGSTSELMVVGKDGGLRHIWQTSANGGWSDWFNHGGSFAHSPALGRHGSGALELFVVGKDGVMMSKHQSAAGSGWSDWVSLGGSFAGAPACGRSGDRYEFMEVMAIGTDGALYHRWQTTTTWSDWYNHGGALIGSPVIARRGGDAALEMMVVGKNGHLMHKWQNGVNAGWSAWFDHGGAFIGPPALALSGQCLEVMAVGSDGQLHHKWQTSPGGGWSEWMSHGGSYAGSPCLVRRDDGGLEVFVTGKDGNVWHKRQPGPNAAWSDWVSQGPLPDPLGKTIGLVRSGIR